MKEPAVSIQMVMDTIPTAAVASGNIAGGVVIADCGTLESKLYYSSTEVLKEFTKSGKITRQTDTTLIHAAAIADIMPVLLKRSYNDDGTRAGFVIYKKSIPFHEDTEIDFLGVTDESVINNLKAGKTVTIDGSRVSVKGDSVDYDSEELGINATQFRIEATEEFNQIKVQVDDSFTLQNLSYAYIVDAISDEVYFLPNQISFDGNTHVVTLTASKKFNAGDTLVLVLDADFSISGITTLNNKPVVYKECYFKNGVLLKYIQDLTLTVQSINPMDFCIGIGDTYYYNAITGDPEISGMTGYAIEGITKNSTVREVVDAINKVLRDGYIDYNGGTNWKVFSEEGYDALSATTGVNNTLGAAQEVLASQGEGYTFTLIAKYPSAVDFSAKVGPNPEDDDLIDVTVITANRTYEYTGSTDKEYVNAYGSNQFIENINDYDGIPFEVHVIPDSDGEVTPSIDILQTPSIAFGKMNIGLGQGLDTRKAALSDLCDMENVKISFLCPFGYPNNGYLQKMATYPTRIWAFMPVGLYAYKDDPEAIIAERPSLSTEYAILLAPHDRSTLMTNWVVDMSLEVAYLSRVQSNAAKSCEFAPMMGKDQATLQVTKPSVIFRKSTREKLLDARIMSLVTRTSEGISYLNKNKCSGGNTILSEEQNCRLACKINRDLDTLLEPILGRYNTEETRDRVTRMINTYFQNNILNQVFSIDDFEVICNKSNNPPEVRANNQLVIDLSVTYLNAIHEVIVYHRALDTASSAQ